MAGEVSFSAASADYVAANRLWHGASSRQRWLWWVGIGAAVLAIADVAFGLSEGATGWSALGAAAVLIVAAAVLLGTRLATLASIPHQVGRMMAQNAALAEPMRCAWSHEGLRFVGSSGTADLRWSRLHRWLEYEASYVFLQTDRLMFIVPRRVLSPAQDADLRATVVGSGLQRR